MKSELKNKARFQTKAIHSGERVIERSVTQPIFQSSTYIFEGEEQYVDVKYGRLNNTPSHQLLTEKIAALENAEAALVTSSGMAAVTGALLSAVEPGQHLISQESLYGGTYYFLRDHFPFWEREKTLFPLKHSAQIESLFQRNTKAIYVESISNPLLEIPDFEKMVEIAHKKGALAIIDNTFATPFNFNPVDLGFDLVIHSATKYLNGHSDVLAGAIVGKKEIIEKTRMLLCHLGPALDPHAGFLLNRGIKTLGVRMAAHNERALDIARFLEGKEWVKRVYYPGLESHPDHDRAKKYFKGFSGMISFDFAGNVKELEKSLKKLQIPKIAPSLGGVESLVTRPSTTSHSGLSPTEKADLGISDTLVRLSVGLEDTVDLIQDLEQAFSG